MRVDKFFNKPKKRELPKRPIDRWYKIYHRKKILRDRARLVISEGIHEAIEGGLI